MSEKEERALSGEERVEHAALPWSTAHSASGYVVNADSISDKADEQGIFALSRPSEECEANAAFIVKACNSHYELLEALREAHIELRDLYDLFDTQEMIQQPVPLDLIKSLELVTEKAEGKESTSTELRKGEI